MNSAHHLPATSQAQRLKVLCAGVLSLVLMLGVARFAYTPLLPLMQQQAGLGVAQGGWLAATNYCGYLCGALLASVISDLVLKDKLYRIGLLLAVATTAMMGLSDNLYVWALSRFLAGLSTAGGMLLGSGLIMNWLIRHHHRPELGIHFSGCGIGIAGCAVAVALMTPDLNWREQWFAFTLMGAALAVPAWRWLPRPDTSATTAGGHKLVDNPPSRPFLVTFMASYFCAGIGYVVSATFIVAIINHIPAMQGQGAWVFLALGVAAAPACILWDLIARRTGEINALILASGLQIVGILLPVMGLGLGGAFAGAMLFGGTFVGMVSLVLAMAGRYYPTKPAKMMGKMTISYGIAQITGPAITGWLGGIQGNYETGLYFAAVVMILGTVLLLALKAIEKRDAQPNLETAQA